MLTVYISCRLCSTWPASDLLCGIGCSTHWSNIHHTLLHALPDQGIVHFHHKVTDFQQSDTSNEVLVTAQVGENKEPKTFTGDLLVAADGSMSQLRAKFRPEDKRRYRSGKKICGHMHYSARVSDMLPHLMLGSPCWTAHPGQLTIATASQYPLQMGLSGMVSTQAFSPMSSMFACLHNNAVFGMRQNAGPGATCYLLILLRTISVLQLWQEALP